MQLGISLLLLLSLAIIFLSAYSGRIVVVGKQDDYHNVKKFLVIVTLFLALFAYYIKPISSWDLFRTHQLIDSMSLYGYHYATTVSEYKELLVINNFYYLISLLQNHDLAQFFVILFDFGLMTYIFLNLMKKEDIHDTCEFAFFFILFLCFYDLTLAISGIRNVLAMSICAVAIYNELYFKKQSFLSTFPLYIIAFLIHPSSVFVLAARVLTIFTKKSKLFFIPLLFLSTAMDGINKLLSSSGIAQLQYLANKMYYVDKSYGEDIRVLIVKVFIAILVLYFCLNTKKRVGQPADEYSQFLLSYTVMMLGGLTNVIFFQRMAYIYGILIIPLISKRINKKSALYYIILAGCTLVILLVVYRFYNVIAKGI